MSITGFKTAMTRKGASAPLKFLLEKNLLISGSVLDYGCGKGADVAALQSLGFAANGYDPHYLPKTPTHHDNVLCTFVLNVVTVETQEKILHELSRLGNKVFITVRRDLPKEGQPGRGCWQRCVTCPEGFTTIFENKSFAIFSKV